MASELVSVPVVVGMLLLFEDKTCTLDIAYSHIILWDKPRNEMYSDKHPYEALPRHEGDEGHSTPGPTQRRPWRLAALSITATIVILLSLAGLSVSNTTHEVQQCGTTASEARSKGCRFETMSFSWLPPSCHDSSVDQEFQARPLEYFRDANYTQPVSPDEVRRGEGRGFYVTQDYHATHCAYLMKKLHRAYKAGGKIDGLITSLEHTSHCVHMVLDPPEEMVHGLQFAYTKWPYCGKAGGYNVDWDKQGEWT